MTEKNLTAIQRARAHVATRPYSTTQTERRLRRVALRFTGLADKLEDTCPLGLLALDKLSSKLQRLSDRLEVARTQAEVLHGWSRDKSAPKNT